MNDHQWKILESYNHEEEPNNEREVHGESMERSECRKGEDLDSCCQHFKGKSESRSSFSIDNATSINKTDKLELHNNSFYPRKKISWREMRRCEDEKALEDNLRKVQNELSHVKVVSIPSEVVVDKLFPCRCLPSWVERLIFEVAESLQVPIEAVAPAVLIAMFIAGRGNFKIKITDDYREAFTAYILVVIESGGKKSAIVSIFREPMNNIETELQMEYDANSPFRKCELELLIALRKRMKSEWVRKLDNKSLEKIEEFAKEYGEESVKIEKKIKQMNNRPQILFDGGTSKGLHQKIENNNEFMGIFDPEGGVLKGHIRSSEDSILLKGYTMESFGYETRKESVSMKSPCLAIGAYVQGRLAEDLYSNEALKSDGLLNRFLPVFVQKTYRYTEHNPKDISSDLLKKYSDKIRSLFSIQRPAGQEGERTYYDIELEAEALDELRKYKTLVSNGINRGCYMGYESFSEKLAGHAIRLACAIHFLKYDVPYEKKIDCDTMKGGIELAEFFEAHARAILNNDSQRGFKYAKAILNWLSNLSRDDYWELNEKFRERDAQRGVGRCKIEDIRAGLDVLEWYGYIGRCRKIKNNWCVLNSSYRFNKMYD